MITWMDRWTERETDKLESRQVERHQTQWPWCLSPIRYLFLLCNILVWEKFILSSPPLSSHSIPPPPSLPLSFPLSFSSPPMSSLSAFSLPLTCLSLRVPVPITDPLASLIRHAICVTEAASEQGLDLGWQRSVGTMGRQRTSSYPTFTLGNPRWCKSWPRVLFLTTPLLTLPARDSRKLGLGIGNLPLRSVCFPDSRGSRLRTCSFVKGQGNGGKYSWQQGKGGPPSSLTPNMGSFYLLCPPQLLATVWISSDFLNLTNKSWVALVYDLLPGDMGDK